MPADRGKDAAERFAAAVDTGRSPLSAGSDADLARELTIVARLRSLEGTHASHGEALAMLRSGGQAFSPTSDEKARAKQRLMAMLGEGADAPPHRPAVRFSEVSRVEVAEVAEVTEVAEVVAFPAVTAADLTSPIPVVTGDADADADVSGADAPLAPVTPLAGRPRRARHTLPGAMRDEAMGRAARRRVDARHAGLARRAGVVGSAALFVLIAFTGTGVFVSQDALPGQTLYPLKRAAEAAALAMTFDDQARAQRNLNLAAIRLGEVEQLIALGGSGVDPQVVRVAMSEFDVAASEGSRALLDGRNAGPDGTLQAWAATQSARLSALRPSLPVPAVPAADSSIALLGKLIGTESGRSDTPSMVGQDSDVPDEVDADTPSKVDPGDDREPVSGTDPSSDPDQRIPGLQPEPGPLADQGGEQPASQTPSDGTDDTPAPAQLPLPLPGAPVTLPPLLPGMPPLVIG